MTKVWQVAVVGVFVVVIFCIYVIRPEVAFAAIAALLFGTFSLGFLFQPKSEVLFADLPAFEGGTQGPILSGTPIGESFPQRLYFRLEVIRLWALFLAAFVPLAFLIWRYNASSDMDIGVGFPPSNLTIVPFYLIGSLYLLNSTWLKERRMIARGIPAWGEFTRNERFVRYVFRTPDGLSSGGICRAGLANPSDNIAIILFDPKDDSESMPASTFWFHRFVLVDRTHLPTNMDDTEGPAHPGASGAKTS